MTAPMSYCWLQVSAGHGPDECALAALLVAERIVLEAKQNGLRVAIIDCVAGNKPGTYDSALISLEGNELDRFVKQWRGTIQWMSASPYRTNCRRKNWFVGVEALSSGTVDHTLKQQDVTFTATRASGPGGQHVNVTESAVRATHRKTGITVVAREERSQHLNKKLAMARLREKLEQSHLAAQDEKKRRLWHLHNCLQRGNPIRTFMGERLEER